MSNKNSNDSEKLVSLINSQQKDDFKSYSVKKNFFNAVDGILYCLKTQRNMPIILGATLIVFFFSWLFAISVIELLFVITAIFLVIITEVANTAVEKTVDLVTEEYHPLAGLAKDVAAGAVLIAVIYSVVTGLIIFMPKFISFLLTY